MFKNIPLSPNFTSCKSWIFVIGLLFSFSCPFCEAQAKFTVAVICGEPEYRTVETIPKFLRNNFQENIEINLIVASKQDKNRFIGLKEIEKADLLILSVHRRSLPEDQMKLIKKFLQTQKPMMAIRTATHAFALRKNQKLKNGYNQWQKFDQEVLGCHYKGHEPSKSKTTVTKVKNNTSTIGFQSYESRSWLYRVKPISTKATVLLKGTSSTGVSQPVAWTLNRPSGGQVFCTTLGHPSDFESETFQAFLKSNLEELLKIDLKRKVRVQN